MSERVLVQIVSAPIACKEGLKDTWREVAGWAAGQLQARFGERVQTLYFDLFDPACPSLPPGMTLPVVVIDEEVLSNGDKISVPMIRRKIEAILAKRTG